MQDINGNFSVLLQAEVLVNSVAGENDQLASCGAIAAAFGKAGSNEMAQAFTQGGPLGEGEMRAFDGDMGQLQCQVVVHLGIRTWSGASSTQVSDSTLLTQRCFVFGIYMYRKCQLHEGWHYDTLHMVDGVSLTSFTMAANTLLFVDGYFTTWTVMDDRNLCATFNCAKHRVIRNNCTSDMNLFRKSSKFTYSSPS